MTRASSLPLVNGILRTSWYKTMPNAYRTFHNASAIIKDFSFFHKFPLVKINLWKKYSTCQSNILATYEEVKEIGTKNARTLLIDVREPEELRETGVIPGSINIPLGLVTSALKDMSDREFLKTYGRERPNLDSPIIFSCKSGKRSAEAQATSQQLGYKNVKNYLGGWTDWEQRN